MNPRQTSNDWNLARRALPILGTVLLLAGACSKTKPAEVVSGADPQIASDVKAARAAYESGGFLRAARYYELALSRARAMDHSEEIARNAYNAAACYLQAGRAAEAEPLLLEAEREFRASGMSVEPVLVLRSTAAAATGRHAEAASLASNALAAASSDSERFDVQMLQFDQAVQRGDVAAATALAKAAGRSAHNTGSVSHRAGAASAEGRLAALQKDFKLAANRFDRAAELWKDVGNLCDMASMLRAAGGAWADLGEPAAAAERYYRAARSFYGQHARAEALACIDLAFKSAEAAKDDAMRRDISALFEQIKKSVEPAHE